MKSPPKAAAGDNLLRGYREVHAFLGYDFGEEVEPDYVLIRANGRVQANYWSQERLEKIVTEKGREPYQGVTFY